MSKKFIDKRVKSDEESKEARIELLSSIIPQEVLKNYHNLRDAIAHYNINISRMRDLSRKQDEAADTNFNIGEEISELEEKINQCEQRINEIDAQITELLSNEAVAEKYEKVKELSKNALEEINKRNRYANILNKQIPKRSAISLSISDQHISLTDFRGKLKEAVDEIRAALDDIKNMPNGGEHRINGIKILPKHLDAIDEVFMDDDLTPEQNKSIVRKRFIAYISVLISSLKIIQQTAKNIIQAYDNHSIYWSSSDEKTRHKEDVALVIAADIIDGITEEKTKYNKFVGYSKYNAKEYGYYTLDKIDSIPFSYQRDGKIVYSVLNRLLNDEKVSNEELHEAFVVSASPLNGLIKYELDNDKEMSR